MIGYYVHHHGLGHLSRARSIARHLGEPVTILSSLTEPVAADASADDAVAPDPASQRRWYHEWITLPLDVPDGEPVDPTANGTLHWAPLQHSGLRRRMFLISEWVERHRPRAFVVDVSVEVALLVRLTGTPTVVVALPGDRSDRAHQAALGAADLVLAPWPEAVYRPEWLQDHRERTCHVGALGRFDGRPVAPPARSGRPIAVVLAGKGGSALTDLDHCAYERAAPGFSWEVLGSGADGWQSDPWPRLCAASVVVSHAGLGAVSEIAAAGRPAVLLPQARPFDEQEHTARALAASGIAIVAAARPEPAELPGLLSAALVLGGSGWRRWSSGQGGARAAVAISQLADRHGVDLAS